MTNTGTTTAAALVTVSVSDLADEMSATYDVTRQSAVEGVEVYLGQINSLDHTEWSTGMDTETADCIRESFAAYYAQGV